MVARYSHLKTPRLRLVPVTEVDVGDIAAAIGDGEITRWLPRVPFPYARRDAEAFQRLCAGKEGLQWSVLDVEGCVGGIGIANELGYWLARRAWGRGYATEMSFAVLDTFFADPGVQTIKSGHVEGNARSRRVLDKLGFRPDGVETRPSISLGCDVLLVRMILDREAWAAARLRIARI